MSRTKRDLTKPVLKALVILFVGFGVAWMLLLSVPPPAAATRLGFAARIAWPVTHLLLTSVLVLGGASILQTIRGSVVPVSRRSKKIGRICCWAALVLALVYVGSVVVVSRDPGKPPASNVESPKQVQPGHN